jgi:hypothetical protein
MWESGEPKSAAPSPIRNYCGFNPRASNCWLHSAGASRKRSTPMPRGKRPSTAARARSGARNASEIVMLTWRTLHFWRVAICLMSVTEPRARNDFVKPATTSGDGADEARATFDPRWANFTFGDAVWNQNLPGFSGWWLLPRD